MSKRSAKPLERRPRQPARQAKAMVGGDEDIDDDLAFNSEDEAQFGNFFAKSEQVEAEGERKKSTRAGGKNPRTDGLREFDNLYDSGSDDSDDGAEGFDISDLLDSQPQPAAKKGKGQAAKKEPKLKHRSARDAVTKEEETLYIEPGSDNRATAPAALRSLVSATLQNASKKDAKAAKRIESATGKTAAVFTKDVDPEVKERRGREHVREEVKERSKAWQPALRELRVAKHVQFPLHGPDESAVPTTLGTIEATVEQRLRAEEAQQQTETSTRRQKRPREETETDARKTNSGPVPMAAALSALLRESGLSSKVHNPAPSAKGQTKGQTGDFEGPYVALSKDNAELDAEERNAADPEQSLSIDYVRKLKAMLSYEVAKRRRFNQIKSKTYRRILRKEKEREEEKKQRALEVLNPDAARRRLEAKMEKLRAEERATQKHKNTSKWVKHAKRFSKFDENTKDAIDDQYREHQRLMQKMDEDAAQELREAAEESESEAEDRRVDELLANPHSLVAKGVTSVLWGDAPPEEDAALGSDPTARARQDLKRMNFMRKAEERHATQLEQEMAELAEDVARHQQGLKPLHASAADYSEDRGGDDEALTEVRRDDEISARVSLRGHSILTRGQSASDRRRQAEEEQKEQLRKRKALADRNAKLGRKSYAPATLPDGREAVAELGKVETRGLRSQVEDSEGSEDGANPDDNGAHDADGPQNPHLPSDDEEEEDAAAQPQPQPTSLAPSTASKKQSRTKPSGVIGGTTVIPTSTGRRKGGDPADTTATTRKRRVVQQGTEAIADPTAANPGRPPAEDEDQEYLVARAFAGDEVDEDFLKMKEGQVETIMKPLDPNAALPGWGEWGGAAEHLNLRHKAKVERDDLARRVEKSSLMKARVDAELKNVIINHEVDIVPTAYSIKLVPRPFANATEYQRSMRQPKGPEWNTATTFRDGVAPRISTRQGTIIEPLTKSTGKQLVPKTRLRKRSREEKTAQA